MSNRVYIANFGEGNALWPTAKANNSIVTVDNMSVHPLWQNRDRDGFIATALTSTLTARGERPTRPTAGRWYNLIKELQDNSFAIKPKRTCHFGNMGRGINP